MVKKFFCLVIALFMGSLPYSANAMDGVKPGFSPKPRVSNVEQITPAPGVDAIPAQEPEIIQPKPEEKNNGGIIANALDGAQQAVSALPSTLKHIAIMALLTKYAPAKLASTILCALNPLGSALTYLFYGSSPRENALASLDALSVGNDISLTTKLKMGARGLAVNCINFSMLKTTIHNIAVDDESEEKNVITEIGNDLKTTFGWKPSPGQTNGKTLLNAATRTGSYLLTNIAIMSALSAGYNRIFGE